MAHFELRHKAILLRKQGKSYSQIKAELGMSKGNLSRWLRNYPLSVAQIAELKEHNDAKIERYREALDMVLVV